MNVRLRLLSAFVLVASMVAASTAAVAFHGDEQEYHPIATDEFFAVWERTDYPVSELEVSRTWIWGPGGYSDLIVEEYDEGEDGEREVQYFDKSRQEMPTLGVADTDDVDSPWFITQGLLATELMTGELQLGDDTFDKHTPSQRSAAGDPDDTTAPTYAAMGLRMDDEARVTGEVIVDFIDREGNVTQDQDLAVHGVTDAEFDEVTEHNIASVFWDFMNSESIVYVNGQFVEDDLFLNPYYAVGRPLAEAYWAWVKVDDVEQHVLIQCFERRCLTYTPGNPEGWEVESGNIGQHYFQWRYHEIVDEEPVEPIVPTGGTFTFDGASEATVEVGGSVSLTAHVTANGVNVPGANVFFWISAEDEATVSIDPLNASTDASGEASVAVTGVAEGEATVNAFVDLDGSGVLNAETDVDLGSVDVTVVPALPALTLDASDLEGASAGDTGDIVATVVNPAEAAGGVGYDAVRFMITVDGPVDCDGADWSDWFTVTHVDGDTDTQGINDTFVCDTDSGNFVGFWGPEAGFPMPVGYDATTTFTVEVQAGAPVGSYLQTVALVDVDDDTILASVSGEYEIVEGDV